MHIQDKQSTARILVCHVAGCEGATTELNVGKILWVEMIEWKVPKRRIQHDTYERKREVSIARHTGCNRWSETISIAKLHLCWSGFSTSLFLVFFKASGPKSHPVRVRPQFFYCKPGRANSDCQVQEPGMRALMFPGHITRAQPSQGSNWPPAVSSSMSG